MEKTQQTNKQTMSIDLNNIPQLSVPSILKMKHRAVKKMDRERNRQERGENYRVEKIVCEKDLLPNQDSKDLSRDTKKIPKAPSPGRCWSPTSDINSTREVQIFQEKTPPVQVYMNNPISSQITEYSQSTGNENIYSHGTTEPGPWQIVEQEEVEELEYCESSSDMSDMDSEIDLERDLGVKKPKKRKRLPGEEWMDDKAFMMAERALENMKDSDWVYQAQMQMDNESEQTLQQIDVQEEENREDKEEDKEDKEENKEQLSGWVTIGPNGEEVAIVQMPKKIVKKLPKAQDDLSNLIESGFVVPEKLRITRPSRFSEREKSPSNESSTSSSGSHQRKKHKSHEKKKGKHKYKDNSRKYKKQKSKHHSR